MFVQKTHQYKMFTPSGSYLGLLPNVTSDFNYNQNIATAFAQMTVEVAQSADVAQLATEALTDEAGNAIQDEAGNNINIERQPDIVGSSNSNALIANNNLIQVYEYSNYYPNGLLVFSGYISKLQTVFGNDDNIVLTCISQGQDLSQYLVTTGDSASISQTTDDGTTLSLVPGSAKGLDFQGVIQTFTVPSAISIGGITVEIATTEAGTLNIQVLQQAGTGPNPSSDPIIISGSVHLGIVSKSAQKVAFSVPTTISPGFTYYFEATWSPDSGDDVAATLYLSSLNPYANGSVYTFATSGTTYYISGTYATDDCYFIVWAHGTSVTGAYANDDPTFMLTDIMTNYISQGGKVQIPQATGGGVTAGFNDASIPTAYWGNAFAQVFTPSSNFNLNTLQLYAYVSSGSTGVSVQLCKGDPSLDSDATIGGSFSYTQGGSNSVIATSNPVTISNTSPQAINITFPSPPALVSGTKYYLLITFGQGQVGGLILRGAASGETPTDTQVGRLYYNNIAVNNSGGSPSLNSSNPYMYFVVNPGSAGGFNNTGNITSYTFKLQTILQAIQTIIGLSPSTWYWFVQPDTNMLNFSQASTTADITIIKGRHINEIDITATKENIVNVAYFSGGDDGTATNTNILVKVASSQGSNRIGLVQLSDNRVNSTSGGVVTAKLIAQNYLNINSSETYITNVTIQDQTMDINLFKLGMMVGFSGFGNFADNLLLQVVGVNRTPDQVILQLGTLPKRVSKAIADIEGGLAYQQTVDNPSTPS